MCEEGWQRIHSGGNSGANRKSISHRCYLRDVAFEWEMTEETIYLPLGCLKGGYGKAGRRQRKRGRMGGVGGKDAGGRRTLAEGHAQGRQWLGTRSGPSSCSSSAPAAFKERQLPLPLLLLLLLFSSSSAGCVSAASSPLPCAQRDLEEYQHGRFVCIEQDRERDHEHEYTLCSLQTVTHSPA